MRNATHWLRVGGPRDDDVAPRRLLQQDRLLHDTNGTAGQAVDVVPDGPHQMDERVAGQQSLQSGAVESGEKRTIQDFFPTPPLAGSGEVFQMLGLRMHDVAVG
jgi:hypothetical protein